MNKNLLIGTGVIVLVIGVVFLLGNNNASKSSSTLNNLPQTQTENKMDKKDEGKMIAGYSGKVLAGTKSPFIVFNKTDYDKALADNKIIVLDFYANWCPVCREEAPGLHAGFDELNNDKVIGFRVNYNDTETDADEKKLATEFGISYQHTKIIFKNGKQVSKSLESWDKETFLKEVNSVL